MIPHDQVAVIAQRAKEVLMDFMRDAAKAEEVKARPPTPSLGPLYERVMHDHLRRQVDNRRRKRRTSPGEGLDGTGRTADRKRREKELRKSKLTEAHYLMHACDVPVNKVAKRLHINYDRLRSIKRQNVQDPEVALGRKTVVKRFSKLHDRGRELIRDLLASA